MSAAPNLLPSAAGSYEEMACPPSTGSSTTCHLIGSEEEKRGPLQYVHFSSSIFREPSRMTSAPGRGFAPTPRFAVAAEASESGATMRANVDKVFLNIVFG